MDTVFADGLAIACKAGDSKVIAAFPDVCLTPPPPPAGPIPVPYPDTSFSKDMQNGSKTVKIGGAEVMLKDQSFYATSPLGDEAATNGQGANVVTHVITGKTYFAAWSMTVKFEGSNVDRFTDLTTSNHASPGPGGPPLINAAKAKMLASKKCKQVLAEWKIRAHRDKTGTPKESHHIMQNAFFQVSRKPPVNAPGACPGGTYNSNSAPCVMLSVTRHTIINAAQHDAKLNYKGKGPTYKKAREDSKNQLKEIMSKEEAECIMLKVDEEMQKMCPKMTMNTQLNCPQ